jgi:hypothetical protein
MIINVLAMEFSFGFFLLLRYGKVLNGPVQSGIVRKDGQNLINFVKDQLAVVEMHTSCTVTCVIIF